MVGIATLAIVESSTCMNVASDSAMVMMTSCAPSSGFLLLHYTHPELSGVGLNDPSISLLTGSRAISRALLS